jgi:hypothetical protein
MKNQEEVVVIQLLLHYHFPSNNQEHVEDEEIFEECDNQFRQAIGVLEEYLNPLKLKVEVISKERGSRIELWGISLDGESLLRIYEFLNKACGIYGMYQVVREVTNKGRRKAACEEVKQQWRRVTSWFIENFFRPLATSKEVRDAYDLLQKLLSECVEDRRKPTNKQRRWPERREIDELVEDSRLKEHRRKFFESAKKKKDMTHIEIIINPDYNNPDCIIQLTL